MTLPYWEVWFECSREDAASVQLEVKRVFGAMARVIDPLEKETPELRRVLTEINESEIESAEQLETMIAVVCTRNAHAKPFRARIVTEGDSARRRNTALLRVG